VLTDHIDVWVPAAKLKPWIGMRLYPEARSLRAPAQLHRAGAPGHRWPNKKAPFNKCNLNADRGTNMHFDKGNARGSVCSMLVIGDFTGGEQVLVNGAGRFQEYWDPMMLQQSHRN
jgi:hypothetical protein